MFIIHLLVNLTIVATELALAAGAGWFAWKQPAMFAAFTAGLAVALGLKLELRRLTFEIPFYFERIGTAGAVLRTLIASGQALLKGIMAGVVALMSFSGTQDARLQVVAAIFAACILLGSIVLRRLTINLGAKPAHWGFFRMAAPLGILYSAAMSFFPAPTSLEVIRRVFLDLPARPSIAQAGEVLFSLRLWIDDLITRLLLPFVGAEGARAIGVVIGSNVLAGFVISLYAVIVSEVVRVMEESHWRMRGISTRKP